MITIHFNPFFPKVCLSVLILFLVRVSTAYFTILLYFITLHFTAYSFSALSFLKYSIHIFFGLRFLLHFSICIPNIFLATVSSSLRIKWPYQDNLFLTFNHWRYFKTLSCILCPELVHPSYTTRTSQHSHLSYVQASLLCSLYGPTLKTIKKDKFDDTSIYLSL